MWFCRYHITHRISVRTSYFRQLGNWLSDYVVCRNVHSIQTLISHMEKEKGADNQRLYNQ